MDGRFFRRFDTRAGLRGRRFVQTTNGRGASLCLKQQGAETLISDFLDLKGLNFLG
jgi:hypothetical protein